MIRVFIFIFFMFSMLNILEAQDIESKSTLDSKDSQILSDSKDLSALSSDLIQSVQDLTKIQTGEITSITKQDNKILLNITGLDSNLNVGESGIITRDLDDYEVLVGNVEIVESSLDSNSTKVSVASEQNHLQNRLISNKDPKGKDPSREDSKGLDSKTTSQKTITGTLTPLNQLLQPYLPTPRLKPQVGDKVTFRSFNNKAFIIAPNEESYNKIKNAYSFIDFINSDLLLGYLNSLGKHDLTKSRLTQICAEYATGLAFIVGSKNVGIFSCANAKIIKKYAFAILDSKALLDAKNSVDSKKFQSPFYSRVILESGGSLTYLFSSKKSKDYYKYYDEFIGDATLEIESKVKTP